MLTCGEISCEQCNEERGAMARAIIEAHSYECRWCPHSNNKPECEDQPCIDGQGCKCPACEIARSILAD